MTFIGIVSSLSLLISPLGAPPPAPVPETPAVNMSTQATICNKYRDARDPALSTRPASSPHPS